jgi:hypothetical protein
MKLCSTPLVFIALLLVVFYAYTKLFRSEGAEDPNPLNNAHVVRMDGYRKDLDAAYKNSQN